MGTNNSFGRSRSLGSKSRGIVIVLDLANFYIYSYRTIYDRPFRVKLIDQ